MFGRVYDIVDDKDMVDETHILSEDIDRKIKERTKFEINKNNYLNDYMQRYYNLLNNVKQFEIPTSQHELIEKIKGIKK